MAFKHPQPNSTMGAVSDLLCPSPCQAVAACPPGTVHASTAGERRAAQPGLLQSRAGCTSCTSPRYWCQAVSPAQVMPLTPLSLRFQGLPKLSPVCWLLTQISLSLSDCTNCSLALQALSATQPEVPSIHSYFLGKILVTSLI